MGAYREALRGQMGVEVGREQRALCGREGGL